MLSPNRLATPLLEVRCHRKRRSGSESASPGRVPCPSRETSRDMRPYYGCLESWMLAIEQSPRRQVAEPGASALTPEPARAVTTE